MAEPQVETMPGLGHNAEAKADDSMMPESKEETAPDAEDRTAPEVQAGDKVEEEQQQRRRRRQHQNFGMLVLAGKIQEDNRHTFE
jgi:hypothetical protein